MKGTWACLLKIHSLVHIPIFLCLPLLLLRQTASKIEQLGLDLYQMSETLWLQPGCLQVGYYI